MFVSRSALLLPCAAALGCSKEAPPAPRSVDDLAHAILADFDDDAALAADIEGLAPFLRGEGSSEEGAAGYALTDLSSPEVDDVPHPDGTLGDALGVGVGGRSPFSIYDHAPLIVLPNQTWNDPATFAKFDREIESGDPDAFAAGEGDVLTRSDVEKSGAFGVSIPYVIDKDYRWVDTADGARAIAARAWVPERSCSDNGKNCVELSFHVEVYYGAPGAGERGLALSTARFIASWNDLRTEADALVSDDYKVQLMVDGVNDLFENTDAVLRGELSTSP